MGNRGRQRAMAGFDAGQAGLGSTDFVALYWRVAQYSDRMLVMAQQEQWQEMLVLDEERSSLLAMIQAHDGLMDSLNDDQRQQLKQAIQQIIAADHQVMVLARARMDDLSSMFASMERERRLLDAYR